MPPSFPEVEITITGKRLKGGKAKIEDWDVFYYVPDEKLKELTYFTIAECLAFTTHRFLKNMKKLVKDYIKENPNTSTVELSHALILKMFDRQLSVYRRKIESHNHVLIIPLLEKIQQITIEFFKSFGDLHVPAIGRKRYLNNVRSSFESKIFCNASSLHSDNQISHFDHLDSHVFKSTLINPDNFSCVSYALFKTGETRAAEFIFSKNQGQFIWQLPKYLKEWGYQSVSHPQAGDLVLYFVNINDTPKHVGIYQSSGLVDSKLGIKNPFTAEHQIFDIISYYGKKVVFFRKTAI